LYNDEAGLDVSGIVVQVLGGARDLALCQSIQMCFGAHSAFFPLGAGSNAVKS